MPSIGYVDQERMIPTLLRGLREEGKEDSETASQPERRLDDTSESSVEHYLEPSLLETLGGTRHLMPELEDCLIQLVESRMFSMSEIEMIYATYSWDSMPWPNIDEDDY
jgi:hypothetical protein